MNVFKRYIPMTESAFYILLALNEPLHGYGIIQKVDSLTQGRIQMGAGTIYGTLSKLEKDGVIAITKKEDRRKVYVQSALGKELLETEIQRLKGLLEDVERIYGHEEI